MIGLDEKLSKLAKDGKITAYAINHGTVELNLGGRLVHFLAANTDASLVELGLVDAAPVVEQPLVKTLKKAESVVAADVPVEAEEAPKLPAEKEKANVPAKRLSQGRRKAK